MNMTYSSYFGQTKIYLGKCFRMFSIERQWKSLVTTFLITVIVLCVIGEDVFIAYKDTNNGSFALVCACIWIGLFNSIRSVCRERSIIKREYRTGMKITAYISAHVIYEAFVCALQSFLVYICFNFRNENLCYIEGIVFSLGLDLFITFFLTIFSSDMMAQMISCCVKDENTAMTIMPFVLIIQLVMSGSIFTLQGFSEAVSNLTISKWAQKILMLLSYTNSDLLESCKELGVTVYTPTTENVTQSWYTLLLFSTFYIIIGVFLLRRVKYDKR